MAVVIDGTSGTSTPTVVLPGSSSGTVTLQAPATAGSTVITFPNSTGTLATTTGSITNLAGGSIGTIPYQSGSGTTAMLAVGTAGQVLTSGGAAAPTWASASADVVLVRTASFSAVADTSTTFDGVFTSTYKSYKVVVRQFYGSGPSALPNLNLRSGGATNTASNYNVYITKVVGTGTSSLIGVSGQSYWDLPPPWTALSAQSSYYMNWTGVGFSNYEVLVSMSGLSNGANQWWTGGYRWEGAANTFDGFIITAAGGYTVTGTIDVYGYK